MAYYMGQAKYSDHVLERMVLNPQDRGKALEELMKKQGFRLVCFFYTFGGDFDSFCIYEVPEESRLKQAGAALATFASGVMKHTKRTPLLTREEAKKAIQFATPLLGKYPPPVL